MKENISGYDIIGDIHGYADELESLLQKMGYSKRDHVWTHPERKAIFVGDYIDRGPKIRETLYIIKSMVDAGQAFAIMGNHEYNALAYDYQLPNGKYLREHSSNKIHQHKETIEQFKNYRQEWADYLAWFKKLPIFLEMDGLRVVHACWDDKHIEYLKGLNSFPLTEELLVQAHAKDTKMWKVFEEVLKGKEIMLPEGHFFIDNCEVKRTECRSRWWLKTEGLTLKEYLFDAPDTVNDLQVSPEHQSNGYDIETIPVFFGHYWLNHAQPRPQAPNVYCLDYGVAGEGFLVAYRYYIGEPHSDDNFTF